jgi:hypothetical protein
MSSGYAFFILTGLALLGYHFYPSVALWLAILIFAFAFLDLVIIKVFNWLTTPKQK